MKNNLVYITFPNGNIRAGRIQANGNIRDSLGHWHEISETEYRYPIDDNEAKELAWEMSERSEEIYA